MLGCRGRASVARDKIEDRSQFVENVVLGCKFSTIRQRDPCSLSEVSTATANRSAHNQ